MVLVLSKFKPLFGFYDAVFHIGQTASLILNIDFPVLFKSLYIETKIYGDSMKKFNKLRCFCCRGRLPTWQYNRLCPRFFRHSWIITDFLTRELKKSFRILKRLLNIKWLIFALIWILPKFTIKIFEYNYRNENEHLTTFIKSVRAALLCWIHL